MFTTLWAIFSVHDNLARYSSLLSLVCNAQDISCALVIFRTTKSCYMDICYFLLLFVMFTTSALLSSVAATLRTA